MKECAFFLPHFHYFLLPPPSLAFHGGRFNHTECGRGGRGGDDAKKSLSAATAAAELKDGPGVITRAKRREKKMEAAEDHADQKDPPLPRSIHDFREGGRNRI